MMIDVTNKPFLNFLAGVILVMGTAMIVVGIAKLIWLIATL